MKEVPLVSVLMTCFNREKYIGEAIESVLSSTYQNFELIIVDDCSKDTSVDIIRKYEKKDSRIQVFINEKNLGDYPNRNKAASYATGKYIKYCDSDDKLFEWTLDYCVQKMEKYPEAGMGILKLKKEVPDEYLISKDSIYKNFYEQSILNIGPSGTILRRDRFELIGQFNPEYAVASDMYFNLKMAASFPIVLLDKVFFFYREHEGQEFNNKYSYLCFNYRYVHDALNLSQFPLTLAQKNNLLKKAKKGFVRSLLTYLKNTGNIKKGFKAYQHSGIGIGGFLRGLFQ